MTDMAYQSLKNNLIRCKVLNAERILDWDTSGSCCWMRTISPGWRCISKTRCASQEEIPRAPPGQAAAAIVRPHMFRHTFCTNMSNTSIYTNNQQYRAGHSDVGVTLNVYTHASLDQAAEQMVKNPCVPRWEGLKDQVKSTVVLRQFLQHLPIKFRRQRWQKYFLCATSGCTGPEKHP